MTSEHVDVVVVGAGLSGIGAGYHLQTMSPDRSYVILEGRDGLGGTWDLFKYPGVRSDSDGRAVNQACTASRVRGNGAAPCTAA